MSDGQSEVWICEICENSLVRCNARKKARNRQKPNLVGVCCVDLNKERLQGRTEYCAGCNVYIVEAAVLDHWRVANHIPDEPEAASRHLNFR